MHRHVKVRTYPVIGARDKKAYSVGALHGLCVDADNLFAVYKGEHIAPFAVLDPALAFLPASRERLEMLSDDEMSPDSLHRWGAMNALWDRHKGQRDSKTLRERLDFNCSLSSQLRYLRDPGDRPVRIAYATNGVPTAALIPDAHAILDTSLYQVTCRDSMEAHYLLSIINSAVVQRSVSPLAPGGLYGAIRSLHKHIWKLPIPAYDESCIRHVRLAQMGRAACAEAAQAIAGRDIRAARLWLRTQWQRKSSTALEIEGAVEAML